MKKIITLLGYTLLFASTQVLADRPAMSEGSDMLDLELESIDDEILPVLEETIPPAEEPPVVESSPEMEPVFEEVTVEDAPAEEVTVDTGPVIHVYDHNTETELQPGETLPVSVVDFPRRGMSMDKVRNELGEALEISDSVGEPPITSWTYNDRIVYFEYSRVLHVVSTH